LLGIKGKRTAASFHRELGKLLWDNCGMAPTMDAEGFGGCTNFLECASVCPKEVSPDFIARMNRDLMGAVFLARHRAGSSYGG
jgi:hypothetical protein